MDHKMTALLDVMFKNNYTKSIMHTTYIYTFT